jgi:hypothetical protein
VIKAQVAVNVEVEPGAVAKHLIVRIFATRRSSINTL